LTMGTGIKNPYRNANGTIRVPERASSFVDPALTHLEAKLKNIVDNQSQADGLYDQIPDSKNGKVIGTDIARELLPEYAANREGKILYTHATGRMAQAYAKDRLWREIQNPRGRTKLMFTAGGVAAGKSTAVTDDMVAASDLVFDGTLRETSWAIQTIELAIRNGWKVEINYVQRPIDLVIRGAISRADRGGRWGSLADLPSIHQAAQASAIRLFKHFHGRPQFRMNLWLNDGATLDVAPKLVRLEQVDIGGPLSYGGIDDGRLDTGRNQGKTGNLSEEFRLRGAEEVSRIFAEAVASGQYEPRILSLLAQGSEELSQIAQGVRLEMSPGTAGDFNLQGQKPTDQQAYAARMLRKLLEKERSGQTLTPLQKTQKENAEKLLGQQFAFEGQNLGQKPAGQHVISNGRLIGFDEEAPGELFDQKTATTGFFREGADQGLLFMSAYQGAISEISQGRALKDRDLIWPPLPVLDLIGAPKLALQVNTRVLEKATTGKHGIGLASLRRFPEAMERPVMIVKNPSSDGQADVVVVTELIDRGGVLIAPVEYDRVLNRKKVNSIRSIHAKERFDAWLEKADQAGILYLDKKKAAALSRELSSRYLRGVVDKAATRTTIRGEDDLVNAPANLFMGRDTDTGTLDLFGSSKPEAEAYAQAVASLPVVAQETFIQDDLFGLPSDLQNAVKTRVDQLTPLAARRRTDQGQKNDTRRNQNTQRKPDPDRTGEPSADGGMDDLFAVVARQRQAERDSGETGAAQEDLFGMGGQESPRPDVRNDERNRGNRSSETAIPDVGGRTGAPSGGSGGRGDREGTGVGTDARGKKASPAEPPLIERPAPGSPGRNHQIARDENPSPKGIKSKLRANLAAISAIRVTPWILAQRGQSLDISIDSVWLGWRLRSWHESQGSSMRARSTM
jgi:hypothetical protein